MHRLRLATRASEAMSGCAAPEREGSSTHDGKGRSKAAGKFGGLDFIKGTLKKHKLALPDPNSVVLPRSRE